MDIHCHMQAKFPGIDPNLSGVTGFDPRNRTHRDICHKLLDGYLDLMATRISIGREETFVEDGFQILTTIDKK